MEYTSSQREAIETIDRNLQIIACAGSGKTQVISARIVEIIRQGNPPASIVAFTFTKKAAGELEDRIDRLCLQTLGNNRGLGDMYVGTIHSYCLNLLQSPPLYRFLKYTPLDEIRQRLLIDRNSKRSGLTSTPLLNGTGYLERWKDSELYRQLLAIYREGQIDYSKIPQEVHEAVAMYEELLHEKRYLDFTTMMSEAVKELESNSDLRRQIADQVKYLVVDEYQDVNPLQERLIWLLHDLGANLCVVGDDDQTIYQWRGSEVQNIITFAGRYPAVHQIRINENFRSSPGIIEPAREVIELNDPYRLPKRMESAGMQPFDYGDVLALSFDTADEEARWIVDKIRELYGTEFQDRPSSPPRGLSYSDFAILFRSVKRDAQPIKEALEKANIPFIVTGIFNLFQTAEVKAMRDIFFFLADFAPPRQDCPTIEDVAFRLRAANLGLRPAQITAGLNFLQDRKVRIQKNRVDAQLFLQHLYLDFLEAIQLREEDIPKIHGNTGEIIFYNLGKFSQVISDFETIHFHTDPSPLYDGFANFLHYDAPGYYPKGWEEHGLARLDAVEILTVHSAKGKQWPAVFVPCLRRNRFPSARWGGRTVWQIIPESAVKNVERYKGTEEDERRLFYVAITRPECYLFCTYSPGPTKTFKHISKFHKEITSNGYVLTEKPFSTTPLPKISARPRFEDQPIVFSFSELKYMLDCGYSFKLRFLYGFDPPINRAIGYGKSLHDALAEIHAESIRGRIPTTDDVPRLVDDHLHLPFANAQVQAYLERNATDALTLYLRRHGHDLDKLEHVERNIELRLADGIVVNGRADLIRSTDTGHWVVVDFKSRSRARAEDTTSKQLQIYALGFEQLTGVRPKLIEVHNLDDGAINRTVVSDQLIQRTLTRINIAGRFIRKNHLPRLPDWTNNCDRCDFSGICRHQNGSP